ncbi:glycosyltransferase [Amylolactobacillus amylophilus]|nr:glycosyltransferase [Amylolactobacillus amylophilus]
MAPKEVPSWVTYYHQPSIDILRNNVYGSSKIYLMPSVLEGWGLTGMEAMACGAVPVASKYGGMLDFMADDINAVLVEKDNEQSFVKTIIDLLQDPTRLSRLSDNAVQITSNFSIETSANKFLKILAYI